MESIKSIMNLIVSSMSTVFIYLFGGLDIALQCLLISIVIDYITGMLKSYKSSKLNSKIGIKGILKKVGILCLVALAVLIDKIAGETGLIRTLIIYYLFANEGLSIVENLSEIGILVPKFLTDRLEQLKEGTKNEK